MPSTLTPEQEFDQEFDKIISSQSDETTTTDDQDDQETPPSGQDDTESKSSTSTTDTTTDTTGENTNAPDKDSTGGDPDFKSLYEQEKQRTSSWEGRIKAANRRAEQLQQELDAAKKSTSNQDKDTALPGSDDADLKKDEDLAAFFNDYPELEKPFLKLVEKKSLAVARKIFDEKFAEIEPRLTNVTTRLDETDAERHFKAIREKHSDFENLVTDGTMEQWIDKQPTLLQKRYREVAQNGTANEVIELFDLIKGTTKTAPTSTTTSVGQSSRAQRMADAEAVVGSHTKPGSGKPDPNDFDAAFSDALRGRKQ